MIGVVAKSTGSWYEVWFENGDRIHCRLRGKFRLSKSTLTNPIAVGDQVNVDITSPEEAVITKIFTRKNYLLRKATKSSSQFQIVASNLDQAIVIATHKAPRTSTGFIDRFLVVCRLYEIEPVIVFNKMDLHTEEDNVEFEHTYSTYVNAGYNVVCTTMVDKELSDDVTRLFEGKSSLLFGHSGVGKSTLLNKLIPSATQSTAVISDQHQKGKHTTTFAQMFEDQRGNRIIDTPGVKEFGLEDMELWKLGHCFKEFAPFIQMCKYNTCLHKAEPKCAVIEAFCADKISEFRFQNYLNILEDLEKS